MIEIENISDKFPKIYKTVDDINNFLLRIRLLEEFSDNEQVLTFKWQQKRFSPQQKEFFKQEKNCLTELHKEYHEQILKDTRKGSQSSSIIFSYIHKDNYTPECRIISNSKVKLDGDPTNELIKRMNDCKLEKSEEEIDKDKKTYDYFEFLQESYENFVVRDENRLDYETMYIMADFGEFYQSTWLKCEYVLCKIQYDVKKKILQITPDFTMFHSHRIKVTSEESKIFNYWIENASLDGVTRQELLKEVNLLQQIQTTKNQQILPKFEVSSNSTSTNVYIFIEILSGWGFEHKNVFVRYYLQLNNWKLVNSSCEDNLSGVTISCAKENSNGKLHFGFPIDLTLVSTYNSNEDPIIHFELISKDTWSRYRSEGFARMSIPLRLPGRHSQVLHCYRLTSSGISNELRRFFIGDCGNYQSLFDKTTSPKNFISNKLATTTISTGYLNIRTSIMHLGTILNENTVTKGENLREMRLRDKLRDPLLSQSVEEAVDAFKKARSAMIQARTAASANNNLV